jgi:NAD(P)H-dependent FMN reductase
LKTILIIVGSASRNSANQLLAEQIAGYGNEAIQYRIYNDLKLLPPFDPEQSIANTPQKVLEIRNEIQHSAAVIFCTPEYVFSIPSGLKNLIEWCVSTTIFENKPLGILTASAHGQKAHEELQRIMKTLMACFTQESTLLIQGIKGKLDNNGAISDPETDEQLRKFIGVVRDLVMQSG